MKAVIIGKKKDTLRYEAFLSKVFDRVLTAQSLGELCSCDAVLLPGGGDITPAFFGEHNNGSRNIDTEMDILQLQAAEYCVQTSLPLLGICKGMQIINVALGGTIVQDLPTAAIHRYQEADQQHSTVIAPDSFLAKLYGERMTVNSAHHQGLGKLGARLVPIQWCDEDNCVEAIVHETLPIIGLQWHPERLEGTVSSDPLLSYFAALAGISTSVPSGSFHRRCRRKPL